MVRIQNETTYKAAMERIEELLPLTDDNVPLTDKNLIELDLLSKLVSEYEDEHYPIKTPSLVDVMKLRMYEMGVSTQFRASPFERALFSALNRVSLKN